MLERPPTPEEMTDLLGAPLFALWGQLCQRIDTAYEMDQLWNTGGKAWDYEYKYRRGGKTLCALYAKAGSMGFLIILGQAEREKFEADRATYSPQVQAVYDGAKTYHDGKWLMLEPKDTSLFDDIDRLLRIKRRPNRA